MNPVKIVKNHASFLVTLTGILALLFLLFMIVMNPVYRDMITVNTPYILTIGALSLVPIAVLKKLQWYPEAAPVYAWAVLFLATGFYYSLSQGPNIIGFLLDLVTLKMTVNVFFSTFFGMLTISGVFILFYFVMGFISASKDDAFSQKVDAKSYMIWTMTYLLYLNAMISIINPIFRHPF